MLWRIVIEQEVKISRQRDRLPRAEQLQRLCVDWDRRQAGPALEPVDTQPNPEQSGKVRVLAESLFRLSEILRDAGSPAVKIEEEAIALRERLGEKRQASLWAFELGEAYTETRAVRDLAQAERWLKRGLELIGDGEPAAKAECLAALGRVAWERFNEVRKANAPEGELRRHLSTARQYYQLALEHDGPTTGEISRATTNNSRMFLILSETSTAPCPTIASPFAATKCTATFSERRRHGSISRSLCAMSIAWPKPASSREPRSGVPGPRQTGSGHDGSLQQTDRQHRGAPKDQAPRARRVERGLRIAQGAGAQQSRTCAVACGPSCNSAEDSERPTSGPFPKYCQRYGNTFRRVD